MRMLLYMNRVDQGEEDVDGMRWSDRERCGPKHEIMDLFIFPINYILLSSIGCGMEGGSEW